MVLTRTRKLQWATLLLAVMVAMFPIASSAAWQPPRPSTPPFAPGSKSFTIISTDTVPILNINVGGTLSGTFSGTADSFSINWRFRGFSSGGGPATASGSGVGSWDEASETLSLSLTGIAAWNIPGFPQPNLQSATVSEIRPTLVSVSVGNIVSGLPMRIFPSFGNPFASRFPFWIASAVGTGTTHINALPGTRSR